MSTHITGKTDVGPIGVSPNGRYFVNRDGEPFFWLGDTQWELFRGFSLSEARAILENRARKGFSVIQVMLIGCGDGTRPNRAGDAPWMDDNPSTPNDRYFAHVDSVLQLSRRNGLILVVGVYHQWQAARITVANARQYAAWIARRYRDVPNLIWTMYPRAESDFVPVMRELAAGLKEGDKGVHLINMHPDPSPASSSFIHNEPWLNFHSIQTWADTHLIRPMVAHDRSLEPAKPVVMAEGAYEEGSEYGFDVTPLWIRRQAYWTCLAGGHHSYGHNDSWRLLPTWRSALDAPGAVQMGILKETLTGMEGWWDLAPDPSLILACEEGDPALNIAAHSGVGNWSLFYLGGPSTVSIRMDVLSHEGSVEASWIAPASGERIPAGVFAAAAKPQFATPGGWEDALLLLEVR